MGSTASAAPTVREARVADRLAAAAEAAWQRGKAERAEDLAERALTLHAEAVAARAVLVQVLLAEVTSLRRLQHTTRDAVVRGRIEADAVKRERELLAHARLVAAGLAQGVDAVIARRLVQDARGRPALANGATPCPAEARRAFEAAELAFLRRDLARAAAGYHAATSACPRQARWHARAGEVARAGGDSAAARAWMTVAVGLDGCEPTAHRGLAELDAQEGAPRSALDHALTAVACDPADATTWLALAALAASQGGVIDVQLLGPGDLRGLRALREAARQQPGESELTRRLLGAVALLDDERPLVTPLLDRLREARSVDLLAEALLVETLDAELTADLLAVREPWRDRVIAYLLRFHTSGLTAP